MDDSPDALTVTLTGALPLLLLLAAAATWPVSMAILSRYRRAIRRTMRTTAGPSRPVARPPAPQRGESPDSSGALLSPDAARELSVAARRRLTSLTRRPLRTAAVYGIAAAVYAAIMTVSWVVAAGLQVFPVRVTLLFWTFFWPAVLTTNVVASATRRGRWLTVVAYFAGLGAIASMGAVAGQTLAWISAVSFWALQNLPVTLFLTLTLSRRIRAVGPLTLSFMFVGFLGALLAIGLAGSSDQNVGVLTEVAIQLGAGAWDIILLVVVVGFLVFAVLGWIVIGWVRRAYEAKRISDESVTITAIWLLFTVYHSFGLVFESPVWASGGVAAFLAFHLTARAGWRWLRPSGDDTPRLLLLRSFAIGRDSERLLDSVEKHWRRTGPMQMIGADDLASRTIEPHELLDFVSGRVARRFIGSPDALQRRLAERDMRPDADGRYRVNDFYCYADTWKDVIVRLVADSSVVLMDLRTFSRANAGCVYEIGELVHLVPLSRVVFLVDSRTDEAFLAAVLERAVRQAPAYSPVKAGATTPAHLFRSTGLGPRELRALLRALSVGSVGA